MSGRTRKAQPAEGMERGHSQTARCSQSRWFYENVLRTIVYSRTLFESCRLLDLGPAGTEPTCRDFAYR
eukprot:4102950-Prymnesium_polylepis.3